MPRKEETLFVLARSGKLQVGTVIEIMPQYLPPGTSGNDPCFQARVVDLNDLRQSVQYDNELYSLGELTTRLNAVYGVDYPGKTYKNWRRKGHTVSLWDER